MSTGLSVTKCTTSRNLDNHSECNRTKARLGDISTAAVTSHVIGRLALIMHLASLDRLCVAPYGPNFPQSAH